MPLLAEICPIAITLLSLIILLAGFRATGLKSSKTLSREKIVVLIPPAIIIIGILVVINIAANLISGSWQNIADVSAIVFLCVSITYKTINFRAYRKFCIFVKIFIPILAIMIMPGAIHYGITKWATKNYFSAVLFFLIVPALLADWWFAIKKGPRP